MSLPVKFFGSNALRSILILSMLIAGMCVTTHAQYPGHINKNADTTPTLRATGVFEWTGDLAQPKAGRLIPLTVWDGQQYQPGGLYLAQPAPLTVLTGTIYELEQAGSPKGLFSVNGAENLEGSWIAVGSVEPEVIKAKAKPPMSKHPPQVVKDAGSGSSTTDSDRPTLHRKDGSDSGSGSGSGSGTTSSSTQAGGTQAGGTQAGSGSGSSTPPSDPDKPTLHRRDSSDSSGSGSGSSSDSASTQSGPADDSDKPTLHRKDSSDNPQNAPDVDPDRPTLHRHQDAAAATSGPVSFPADPDRPKLRYGKPVVQEGMVQPAKLEGLPMDMNQMAAISDVKARELHPYTYSWADPADAAKMKAAMEEQAQKGIAAGFTTATTQTNVTKTATKSTTTTRRKAAPPPPLPALEDEKFSVFELSYNAGATLVLTAKTTGVDGVAKYITLVAQPDFYGTPHVLFKQLTSDKALDIVPRMRLVDVADTDGDGRAELIFELRGKTGRSFGIYRLSSGHVLEAFNTGPVP
jgi:hypothetical protein